MPDSFTSDKVAALQMATGENENTWGSRLNDEALAPLADAIAGRLAKSVAGSSDVTLTASEATNAIQEYTGALTGSINVIVPTATGFYLVYNNTSGAYTLTVKTSAGSGVTVAQGKKRWLYCDGTDVVDAVTELPALLLAGTLDMNGAKLILDADGDTSWIADTDDQIDAELGGTQHKFLTGDASSLALHSITSINGGPLAPINPFLNPSFDLAREGTSFTPSGSTLTYVLDHWGAFRSTNANYTISQVGSEGARRMRIQRDSGTSDTNAIVMVYAFRSEDVAHLAGQTVALNFSAVRGANFSAASNQVTVAIVEGQGTNESLADLRSGSWTSQANVVSTAVTIPSGLDRISVSGDVSANATQIGIRITFTPVGTAGSNDYFDITNVDLKIGATETPFARVPQDWALARSERHLTLKGVGTPCYASSATQVRVGVTFDEMVDTPTLSLTSSTPNVIIASSSELGSGSTIAAATVVNNGFRIIVGGFSGLTANEPGHINSTDLFKLDARL